MPSTSWPCRRIWWPLIRPTQRRSSTGRGELQHAVDWFHETCKRDWVTVEKIACALGCDPLDLLIAEGYLAPQNVAQAALLGEKSYSLGRVPKKNTGAPNTGAPLGRRPDSHPSIVQVLSHVPQSRRG